MTDAEFQRASTGTKPILEVQGLSIRLPAGADRQLAVNNASVTVNQSETVCIVGESGSGKSMVANAVMGLLPVPHVRPVAGSVLFGGKNLLDLSDAQMREFRGCRIGMVFQEPMTALNPVMRIGDQLAEVLDAHLQLSPDEKRKRIIDVLNDVHLPDPDLICDSYPFRLSGGQRQRVVIACALLLEPALLICDEPTTALDVTTQAQILKLIRELQERRGTAVLFITHDFGVVSEIADRVVVMQGGEVVETGLVNAVLNSPVHPYTRKLIAAVSSGSVQRASARSTSQPLLETKNVFKTYRTGAGLFKRGRTVAAVQNVSLQLYAGETLGIVGESGSGKSTFGRCLVGLTPFDSGLVVFNGQTLDSGHALRKTAPGQIQMVFQDPYGSLNPRHRVGAAIARGPVLQGASADEADALAKEMLALVGLSSDAAQRYPHEFSGGQRQRIGIARALAMRPKLLVADEPVSALDVSVQAQVLDLFTSVRRQFQLAMVFITHDLRVAGMMCDRIAVMQSGRVVEYGLTEQILNDPQHAYTQSLIAAVPRLKSGRAVEEAAKLVSLRREHEHPGPIPALALYSHSNVPRAAN